VNPGTLDQLHDFYQPPPPAWMPQTVGSCVIFGLLLLLAAWSAWRIWARWRVNRYRRAALRELDNSEVAAVPALLKRTALAAWPRDEVASLSGQAWIEFLESHGGLFTKDTGRLLLDLDYQGTVPQPEDEQAIRQAASEWIRRHRVRA
jgi:hypothetical protein